MPLPKIYEYNQDNKPDWLTVETETGETWTLKVEILAYDRMKITEQNIKRVELDFSKLLTGVGLTASEMIAMINMMRFTLPQVTLIIDGSGEDTFKITLPPGITVYNIVKKATGETVPFAYDPSTNTYIFTVTFSSEVELTLMLMSTTQTISSALTNLLTITITLTMIGYIMRELSKLGGEIR